MYIYVRYPISYGRIKRIDIPIPGHPPEALISTLEGHLQASQQKRQRQCLESWQDPQ